MSSGVSTIQGGLWQDLIDGVPVLKLRYGDYEYNFNYDTSNRTGDGTTPLNTTTKGVGYVLTTVPSSEDGQLWYEVANNVPTLMIHKWAFDYGFNYDTITYKGSNANLYSYLPFESTTADACGNIKWTNNGATIARSPLGINTLKNTGSLTSPSNVSIATCFTMDFWLYTDVDNLPTDDIAYIFFRFYPRNSWNNVYNANITIKNKQFGLPGNTVGIPENRTHFAITKTATGNYLFYINGKYVGSYMWTAKSATGSTSKANYLNGATFFPSFSADYPAYIDHFRMFKDQVVWTEDFTPPVAKDYLK